jgi:hypothetical protein
MNTEDNSMSAEKRLFLAFAILSVLIIPTQCANAPITLPEDGYIQAKVASVDAAGDAKLSLDSPISRVLFESCKSSVGKTSGIQPNLIANTNLIFSALTTWDQGMTIKSTDSTRCRVTHPANNKWILGFEDGDDGDFNDFVIEITFKKPPTCALNPPNRIIMPFQGNVLADLVGSDADNDAVISLTKPKHMLIWSSAQHSIGGNVDLGNFDKCSELVFSLVTVAGTPGAPAGKEYLSTDSKHCKVIKSGNTRWELSWEDGTDNDFNDFKMQISLS